MERKSSTTVGRRRKSKASAVSDFKKLKLLVTVINRNKTELYLDVLSGFEVNFQTAVLAQGTAKSDTLRMLGFEDSEKSVILSVIREDRATEALHTLEDKFQAIRNGKGIAFTIPLSSTIGVFIYRFLCNHKSTPVKEEK